MSAVCNTTPHDPRCDCMSGIGREVLRWLVLPLLVSFAIGSWIFLPATSPQPRGPAPEVALEAPGLAGLQHALASREYVPSENTRVPAAEPRSSAGM